jgi:hypothetical protein
MQAHQFAIGSHLIAWHIAHACLPTQQCASQWSWHRVGQSSLVTHVVDETDGFVLDVRDAAHSHAAPTRDRDFPASGEVASIPMRISPAGASNWLSFSCQICQPSLALAKVIDLMTTLLSGRQMQPAQDWLPISIPQTYLITAPSEEGAGGGIFIAHLLFSLIFRPCSFPSIILRRRSFFRQGKRETRPKRRERQLMLDRQSGLAALGCEPLAVATSLIDP